MDEKWVHQDGWLDGSMDGLTSQPVKGVKDGGWIEQGVDIDEE